MTTMKTDQYHMILDEVSKKNTKKLNSIDIVLEAHKFIGNNKVNILKSSIKYILMMSLCVALFTNRGNILYYFDLQKGIKIELSMTAFVVITSLIVFFNRSVYRSGIAKSSIINNYKNQESKEFITSVEFIKKNFLELAILKIINTSLIYFVPFIVIIMSAYLNRNSSGSGVFFVYILSTLFIVWVIYFVIRTAFSEAIYLDKKIEITKAIKESFEITKNKKIEILKILLIVMFISFLIGLFIGGIMLFMVDYTRYYMYSSMEIYLIVSLISVFASQFMQSYIYSYIEMTLTIKYMNIKEMEDINS